MPHTFASLPMHVVFSTKNRAPCGEQRFLRKHL
jgi:hypothetical protein